MLRNRFRLVSSLALTLVAAGCSDPGASPSPPEEVSTDEGSLINGTEALKRFDDTGILEIKTYDDPNIPTCTAARVGPRHILTAAHCLDHLKVGFALTVSHSSHPGDDFHATTLAIAALAAHPIWAATQMANPSGLMAMRAPFPPDVAVITLVADLPSTIPMSLIDTTIQPFGAPVYVVGYGCRDSVGGPDPIHYDLYFGRTQLIAPEAVNAPFEWITPLLLPSFNTSYFVTPGPFNGGSAVGLCPGDSGGPVFGAEHVKYPGGKFYYRHTNTVLGINANYTFGYPPGMANGGTPVTNIHTRLNDAAPNFVVTWLRNNLPATSFR